jgi:glycosyltransferase involved in cell wall biosynthesis
MRDTSSPLVSIITPCLNSVRTLELTLSSVAAQTYPNVEHIVVDGGSNDGTVDLLRRFRSKVPLRWLSESDTGMYAAINKGIRLAEGDVLAYLNSDDLYLPWSVESAVTSMLSMEADLVFGDVIGLVKRGGISHWFRIHFYPRFRPRVYAHEVNMGQPSVFWHRRVSDTLGDFDEQLRYCGDFEYWLRTGAAGFRYAHAREVLAVAVDHEESLANVHGHELQREFEETRTRYSDVLKPRRFLQVRAMTRLIYWRWKMLMLRFNLRRARPSSWPNLIQFLETVDLDLKGGSIIPLLLPMPLPRSWVMWGLDPAVFERKLAEELRSRRSVV